MPVRLILVVVAALLACSRAAAEDSMSQWTTLSSDDAINWISNYAQNLDRVREYKCLLVKRERINGELSESDYLRLKIRHQPHSVYIRYLTRRNPQLLYVEGTHDDKILAVPGRGCSLGVLRIPRESKLFAFLGHYSPIELGMRRTFHRFRTLLEADKQLGEWNVKVSEAAKINSRACTIMKLTQKSHLAGCKFYRMHVFVDNEMQIPIRFARWDWPANGETEPPLTEEFTFIKMNLEPQFDDEDFNERNPAYSFYIDQRSKLTQDANKKPLNSHQYEPLPLRTSQSRGRRFRCRITKGSPPIVTRRLRSDF